MCRGCWDDDPTDERTPETGRLVELIDRLYQMPECGAGGPLHSVVDDWNLNTEVIEVRYVTNWYPEGYAPEVVEVCDEIVSIMNRMTENQRATALAIHNGYIT
jgi:hypothetical protein